MTILERDLICLFQTNTASVGRKKRHARRQEISTPIFSWAAFLVSRIVPFNATTKSTSSFRSQLRETTIWQLSHQSDGQPSSAPAKWALASRQSYLLSI
jgi:hypothetical protein